jgi:hypothetical protein
MNLFAVIKAEAEAGIHLVPPPLQKGLMAHILHGRHVGHFLTACLSNDLRQAVGYGDDESLAGIRGIIQFLHNYAPSTSWGTPAKVEAWRARKGAGAATGLDEDHSLGARSWGLDATRESIPTTEGAEGRNWVD